MAGKTRLGPAGIPRPALDTSLFANKEQGTSLEGAEGMTAEEWYARRRRLRSRGRITGEGTRIK